MAIRADWQQFSSIAGERRIYIPTQTAQNDRVCRLLRRGHLLDDGGRKNLVAIEHGLSKYSKVVGRRKDARMAGDASHATGSRVVDDAMQHDIVLIVFGRCDFSEPFLGWQKPRVGQL